MMPLLSIASKEMLRARPRAPLPRVGDVGGDAYILYSSGTGSGGAGGIDDAWTRAAARLVASTAAFLAACSASHSLSCSSSSTGGATVSARVHDREGEPRANAAGANDENLSTERSSDDVEPPSDMARASGALPLFCVSVRNASGVHLVRTTRRRFSTRERRDSHTPAH